MSKSIIVLILRCFGLCSLLLAAAAAAGNDTSWPRELDTDLGVLTIYQPQPETLTGNVVKGRAAASLLGKNAIAPTFGVFWFTGRVDTDRDAGTSMLRDIVVTKVRWPDSADELERQITQMLSGLMPKTGIPLSLPRLQASLATAESEAKSLEGLKRDPPKIVVVDQLAELLQYDGKPRRVPIPDSELEQVVNSPFAVVCDKRDGACYLSGGTFWYRANDPMGPWTSIEKPPAEIAKVVPPDSSAAAGLSKAPRIVVATEPTELISTDGPAAWKPIGKGELLYIVNTETPVIREVASGKVFVLISGRWYTAGSLAGPWENVRPDRVPASFKDLPPASDLGAVRVSVAGTPEANDAMLDAQVPQTAAIDRAKATLEVLYDGAPQFAAIAATGVEYAINTASQVLRIGGKYYACDDAVWFVSAAATGPWRVADSVPMEEIQKIPPSAPVYNVTYVRIYEATPTVVYVGYTPGYVWAYPWYGCPVYGTGWYYPPYWGPVYYYPRPVTYGMHVTYNPWTGWSYGFSYSNGFMRVGISVGGGYGGYYRPGYPPGYYRPPGYYPPGGYRPPYYPPGHRPGYRPPNTRPVGPRPTPYTGSLAAARPAPTNLYRDSANRNRVAPDSMQRVARLEKADRVAKSPNNVLADRDGNIYRKTAQGWESREQGRWSPASQPSRPAAPSTSKARPAQPSARPVQPSAGPAQPSARPAQPSAGPAQPSARPAQPSARRAPPAGLDRDYQARQRGARPSR